MVPTTAPRYVIFEGPGIDAFADSPEWSTTLVMFPFMYYYAYGDDSLIRTYYPNMRRYVDYLTSRADKHIVDYGLGDWYDYGNFRAGFSRNTSIAVVATAHYYMNICHLAEAARMIGNMYDAEAYGKLAGEVKEAFNDRFLNKETNQYDTGSQCANALALYLNLVPAERRQAVLDNLVADIKAHGTRLTTGDVGNRYLFQTLARNGLDELMYAMHNHEEAPGYGFQLKFGATTLTEQWDPRQGSSWNHFMMGQIDEWLFKTLAGIQNQPGTHGLRHLLIAPTLVGDLQYVKASTASLYGKISVDCTRTQLTVEIPVGSDAVIVLPNGERKQVGSGHHTFSF